MCFTRWIDPNVDLATLQKARTAIGATFHYDGRMLVIQLASAP